MFKSTFLIFFTTAVSFLISIVPLQNAGAVVSMAGGLVSADWTGFTGAGMSPGATVAGTLDSDDFFIVGLSDGDSTSGGTHTTGDFARGMSVGGVSTGGMYAFTIGSATAIGIQPGGADFTPGVVGAIFQNDTGALVTSIAVQINLSYYNDQDRSTALHIAHATSLTTAAAFTQAGTGTSTPAAQAIQPAWIDLTLNETISGISLANGDSIFIGVRGEDNSLNPGSGSRDEFALRSLSATAAIVPEPATSLLLLAAGGAGLLRRRRNSTAGG